VEPGSEIPISEVPEPSPDKALRYHLPVFEGPLDLLLYLIQKNEIEIADIPIVLICQQYENHLDQMRDLDLDVAADFILMAATLILIKSRMLLPPPPEDAGAVSLDDPRQPLVEQLLAYQRFKELSHFLQECESVSSAQYARQEGALPGGWDPEAAGLEVDLYDLLDALQRILKRAADHQERLVYAPEVSLVSCMNIVLDRLGNHGSLLFAELFSPDSTRLEIVVTFLALLELVKQKVVLLFQEASFGPLRVVLAS